jgi:hypothetical protein
LEVSEDYARKKMRCDQCGVIFDLPEPANRSSIPAKPPSRSVTSAPAPRRSPNKKTDAGVPASVPPTPTSEAPAAATTSVQDSAATTAPRLDEPSTEDSGDDFAFADGKDPRVYEGAKSEIRECPHCHATVHPEALACSACGFLLVAKKRSREAVAYRWESGWPLRRRIILFVICQALALAAIVAGVVAGMSPLTFIFPYVMYTGMTAFLLGSYNWVDLTRNNKGKLRLTQTWRICFFTRPSTTLRIRDYEELASGMEYQFDTTDWIMFLFLFLCGILPGLWWWFYRRSKNTYFLALCRDHGYPVVTLYRGWNREHMEDMAETICSVADLPLRR